MMHLEPWQQVLKIPHTLRLTIMKRYLCYIICTILICSCTINEKKTYFEKIQGDWVSDIFPSKWKDVRFIFSFEDSLCTYLYAWGEYTNFKIKDNLLLIKETNFDIEDSLKNKQTYTFKIIKLNNDTLQLNPLTEETKLLFNSYDKINSDTITFLKVKAKNNIVPSNVTFLSSMCFGSCPSLIIEIDSSRKVKFYGHAYTKLEGGFKGIIGFNDYSFILNKIRNIQLDSVKENYSSGWTDDQTCGIVIDYNNKSVHSRVYGFDKEPIELRILFHKLIEIYKSLDLEKDSIDLSKFKHYEMYSTIVPPSPPHFDQKNRFIPPNVFDTLK
jgi:hypothetical protein